MQCPPGANSRGQLPRAEARQGANHPNPPKSEINTPLTCFPPLLQKALETFYALGPSTSERILAKHYIHPRAKMGSLAPKTITALTAELSTMKIENDARKELQDNIKRLRDMGTYRGKRHAQNLPVRGQRTRTQTITARKLNRVDRWN